MRLLDLWRKLLYTNPMMPWREFRDLSYMMIILAMGALVFLGIQLYRTYGLPEISNGVQKKSSVIAGIQHPAGYPPVQIAVPPTSIFTSDTYTALRSSDNASQRARIIRPLYSITAVAPNVYKSMYFASPTPQPN